MTHIMTNEAALRFEDGRSRTEREVNNQLLDWLAHKGSMLVTDHVELRRVLVNVGLLARDGFGRLYWRPHPGSHSPRSSKSCRRRICHQRLTTPEPSATCSAQRERDCTA